MKNAPFNEEVLANVTVLKWAYNVALTRSTEYNGERVIAPMADMFNHGTETEVEISYDGNGDCYAVAQFDIPAGSPLRVSYGDPTVSFDFSQLQHLRSWTRGNNMDCLLLLPLYFVLQKEPQPPLCTVRVDFSQLHYLRSWTRGNNMHCLLLLPLYFILQKGMAFLTRALQVRN